MTEPDGGHPVRAASRWAARLDPTERYGLRLSLAAVAVILVAAPFSYLLFAVLGEGPLTDFDGRVADDLNRWVHERAGLVTLLQALSWVGRPPVLAVFVIAGVLFVLVRRQPRLAVFLVATSLSGGVVSTFVKLAVDRPRPAVDHPITTAFGKSFPSGHAMSSTVVFGALLVVFLAPLPRRARLPAVATTVVLVLSIGASRLLLGVHFVSDVVGGHILGLAWLAAAVAVFETWRADVGRPRSRVLAEGLEPEAADDLALHPDDHLPSADPDDRPPGNHDARSRTSHGHAADQGSPPTRDPSSDAPLAAHPSPQRRNAASRRPDRHRTDREPAGERRDEPTWRPSDNDQR